jgi:hypothetical protein
MATNGMLIEFGVNRVMQPEDMKSFESLIGTLNGWKGDGTIEEFRYYAIVTGNREDRVSMIMLEVSHEQLEKLVQAKPWAEFLDALTAMATNVTVNRAVTLQRLMELMSD